MGTVIIVAGFSTGESLDRALAKAEKDGDTTKPLYCLLTEARKHGVTLVAEDTDMIGCNIIAFTKERIDPLSIRRVLIESGTVKRQIRPITVSNYDVTPWTEPVLKQEDKEWWRGGSPRRHKKNRRGLRR